MNKFFLTILVSLSVQYVHATFYASSATAVENPMSQGGRWYQGGDDGLDWKNVRTSSGVMIGEDAPVAFSDPHAVLKGAWGCNQFVTGIAYCRSPDASQFQEIEFMLRHVISAHYTRGLEVNFRCLTTAAGYSQAVFWNGALGDFNVLSDNQGATFGVNDGDIIAAIAIGPTVTAYINGVSKYSFTDPWSNFYSSNTCGGPGVAFNYHDQSVKHQDFGIRQFTATDDRGVISTSYTPGVQTIGGAIFK